MYGFKPYGDKDTNVSEEIIKRLPRRMSVKTVILPVKFSSKQFLDAVRTTKPHAILGLGECGRGVNIREERKAVNYRIVPRGPKFREMNTKLKPDPRIRVSYDAGSYVCNFSMYILADVAERRRLKFAFLHIPHAYNANKATRVVRTKLRELAM